MSRVEVESGRFVTSQGQLLLIPLRGTQAGDGGQGGGMFLLPGTP